jgi:hypothetical protein
VQGFLDASDEVDIDQEIVDDILDGFDGYLNDCEEEDVDVDGGKETLMPDEQDDGGNSDWKGSDDDGESGLDVPEDEGVCFFRHIVSCTWLGRENTIWHRLISSRDSFLFSDQRRLSRSDKERILSLIISTACVDTPRSSWDDASLERAW